MTPSELERLRPSEGARFLFELDRDEDGGRRARYRAWILTPTDVCGYRATLCDDGTVALAVDGAAAGEEWAAVLEVIAKLTARAAAKKRDDGLPPWPPRITRWRGAGRGARQSSSSS